MFHNQQACSEFAAICMSKKGKAKSDVSYNPDDPPEAYSNPNAYARIRDYTSAMREMHGSDFDPASQEIDSEVVMKIGEGKKHGRYWIGDNLLSSSSFRSLSEIRVHSTRGPNIRERPTPSQQVLISNVWYNHL